MCIDFRDLNKESLKDDFLLRQIDVLLDNTARHNLLSFTDGYVGNNQIKITKEDMEKTTFFTRRKTYCYTTTPFKLENARATYQRSPPPYYMTQCTRKHMCMWTT